jgi:hypothetical protein
MTVTSKKEEETGYLGPVSQRHLKASNCSNSELSRKMVLGNRALINTSKYCLKTEAVVGLTCGVKWEIAIATFNYLFIGIDY